VAAEASLPLVDRLGNTVGTVMLRTRRQGRPIIDVPSADAIGGAATFALVEDGEYVYELNLKQPTGPVRVGPTELLDADDANGLRGRLRPGRATGLVTIDVSGPDGHLGTADIEVRTRKLEYLDDYRSMLSSIANEGAELLMLRFAPSSLTSFTPSVTEDARTLYQRFAFLQTLLTDAAFRSAVATVLSRPHEEYEHEEELRHLGQGAPVGSRMVAQLTRAGPRTELPHGRRIAGSNMFPSRLLVTRFVGSTDSEPNRFVRMAFEQWRLMCITIRDRLASTKSAPGRRGVAEAERLVDEIDAVLNHPVMRTAGPLVHYPLASQVLQKREGYREILRAFTLSQAAARLDWDGGEDVYGANQRDVATLYEYWCYLQLRRILADLCDDGLSVEDLFKVSKDGLTLQLHKGQAQSLSGTVHRGARTIHVALWFNRQFASQSWSRRMRPDCSVRLRVEQSYAGAPDDVWIHFDAKYRVDDDDTRPATSSHRADILKMHAYRDAIKGSAGAYVLYPGQSNRPQTFTTFDELLPGVGAFPFRIGGDGSIDTPNRGLVQEFLSKALDHMANQGSRHERIRYWTAQSTRDRRVTLAAERFLQRPPADTPVLLGYVKSDAHLAWIIRNNLYNLRADERTGSVGADPNTINVDLVVLYGPSVSSEALVFARVGTPRVFTKRELVVRRYPDPGGSLYLCLSVRTVTPAPHRIPVEWVEHVARSNAPAKPPGWPVVVAWADVASPQPG
jgi:predicted component of viral defense system (DUF524 family)